MYSKNIPSAWTLDPFYKSNCSKLKIRYGTWKNVPHKNSSLCLIYKFLYHMPYKRTIKCLPPSTVPQLFIIQLFRSSGHYEQTSKKLTISIISTDETQKFHSWHSCTKFQKVHVTLSNTTNSKRTPISVFTTQFLTAALQKYKKYKHMHLLRLQWHSLLVNIQQYN